MGVKIRYTDFKIVTRDLTLPDCTADAGQIRLAAGRCLKRIDLTKPFRLLGVKVSHLQKINSIDEGNTSSIVTDGQGILNLE